ncbi:MAG: magnesium transporter [Acidobacteriota bacterium]
MQSSPQALDRRAHRLADTVRRFVRRGANRNISRVIGKVRPEDVAKTLELLTPSEQLEVFLIALEDFGEVAGEVLLALEPSTMLSVLQELSAQQIADLLRPLQMDDTVALVDVLPEELREQVVGLMEVSEGDELQTQLTYADDSAGRIMNTEFFALSEETTVGQAISRLRELGEVEMVFYLYVVDDEGDLSGVTSLRQLLLTDPGERLGDIMNRSVIRVHTETDQEEVAQLASRYDLLAIPVTDEINRLVGIVTVDDVIDIVQEEAEEDFFKMVGTTDDELLYQAKSWKVARIRLPWILVNLVGLCVTGVLMELFQVRLQEALFLIMGAPVVMGMGGNIGAQTSTIAVRGISTGRLSPGSGRNMAFVLQQVRVGLLLGLVSGLLVALGAWVVERNPTFSLIVGVSLVAAILLASFTGSIVPLLFERFGVDPAVAAGPMVTTTSDIMGIVVYFSLAFAMIDFLLG